LEHQRAELAIITESLVIYQGIQAVLSKRILAADKKYNKAKLWIRIRIKALDTNPDPQGFAMICSFGSPGSGSALPTRILMRIQKP
jgi:hypothetical protein